VESAPPRAVFLSYASQDAEAAKRICEALRAQGVEVWFDQNELVGGDAWDAKIRTQIAECALFVPLISANTQARLEGYFRIEWKLAARRTHAMAAAKAFLLPVVLDDTRDAGAHVPDEFREVQWTRLPGGEVTEAFCARVRRLVHGSVAETPSAPAAASAEPTTGRPSKQGAPRWVLPASVVGFAAVAVGVVLWKPWDSKRSAPAPAVSNATAPLSQAAQMAEQAHQLTRKVTLTREDLEAADSLSRRALELEPQSARVVAVRAWVQAAYVDRRISTSAKHLADVQATASRALALNSADADAMNALAIVMLEQRVPAEAERLLREAVRVAPDHGRSPLLLANALVAQNRREEAKTLLQETIRVRPQDPIARFELARTYAPWNDGSPTSADVSAALEQLDAAIAIQPFEGAYLLKAWLLAVRRGDLVGMRATLDQLEKLPVAQRTSDRAIFVAMVAGMLERRPERVIAAAALSTRPFLEDTLVSLPRDLYIGLAYKLAGKTNLAQQHFRLAEAANRERDTIGDPLTNQSRLAFIQATSGQTELARRTLAPVEAAWQEDLTPARARILARAYAGIGDAAKSVPYLEKVLNASNITTDHVLLLDPWWDPLRGQPEFERILDQARARIAAEKAARR